MQYTLVKEIKLIINKKVENIYNVHHWGLHHIY